LYLISFVPHIDRIYIVAAQTHHLYNRKKSEEILIILDSVMTHFDFNVL
jgi:hypothetical protein